MKKLCVNVLYQNYAFLVNWLPASQKLPERKKELKDGIITNAVSCTLNDVGQVPDPATDLLHEWAISPVSNSFLHENI